MPAFGSTHAGGQTGHGGFGRLFNKRENHVEEKLLVAIAATMGEGMDLGLTQGSMPAAGYTYLGQFIDHDLTSDRRLFGEPPAVEPVENFSTSQFDLDSVYGSGPHGEDRDLYVGDHLLLNSSGLDLMRCEDGSANIRDIRNDSNRIVSQMHVAFIRFHNRVVGNPDQGGRKFSDARTIVCQHYQWVVLHDFLPTIVGPEMVGSILEEPGGAKAALKFIVPEKKMPVPLEFSAAAFRFGHSMVRSAYQLNAASGQMLTFDGGQPGGDKANDLRGFRPLPDALAIDWKMFFHFPGGGVLPQQARPIDTLLAQPLFELPFKVACSQSVKGRRLPYRNLHRSEFDLGLPSGQQVALEMRKRKVPGTELPHRLLGIELPIVAAGALPGDRDIGGTGISKAELEQQLTLDAPLWYYVLKEAEHFHDGRRLGTVGGRIVAEVIIGLMLSDDKSVLRTGWAPKAGEFGCRQNRHYGIVDFLAFAGGA